MRSNAGTSAALLASLLLLGLCVLWSVVQG
jgi:hypothetical protein